MSFLIQFSVYLAITAFASEPLQPNFHCTDSSQNDYFLELSPAEGTLSYGKKGSLKRVALDLMKKGEDGVTYQGESPHTDVQVRVKSERTKGEEVAFLGMLIAQRPPYGLKCVVPKSAKKVRVRGIPR